MEKKLGNTVQIYMSAWLWGTILLHCMWTLHIKLLILCCVLYYILLKIRRSHFVQETNHAKIEKNLFHFYHILFQLFTGIVWAVRFSHEKAFYDTNPSPYARRANRWIDFSYFLLEEVSVGFGLDFSFISCFIASTRLIVSKNKNIK